MRNCMKYYSERITGNSKEKLNICIMNGVLLFIINAVFNYDNQFIWIGIGITFAYIAYLWVLCYVKPVIPYLPREDNTVRYIVKTHNVLYLMLAFISLLTFLN